MNTQKNKNHISHAPDDKNIIWGHWTCPVCGDVSNDPNSTVNTICHNGHPVTLMDGVERNGEEREAIVRKHDLKAYSEIFTKDNPPKLD